MLQKDPYISHLIISKRIKISTEVIARLQKQLVEKGLIPEISRGEKISKRSRQFSKITNVLKKESRQKILQENKQKIANLVKKLYNLNKKAFDFTNMLPETILEKVIADIDWRLQRYDPEKMPGKESTKLARYVNRNISFALLEAKRTAWRKHKKVISIETENRADTIRQRIQARPETKEITIKELEKISKKLKLTIIEKSILFGKAAGMNNLNIGKAIRYSEGRISQINSNLEKRLKAQF